MLIAQISDSHIAGYGDKAYTIAPTAENLARCVDHINQIEPGVDFVLVTGDITYSGREEEAERAALLLDRLDYPFYIVPGNHDFRKTLWSVFGGRACPEMNNGFINYVIEGRELRLIAVDSTVPGEPGGEICSQRAKWLDERLAENREQPTLLFMHHPPMKFGVLETDEDGFSGSDLLGDVVEKYPNILRILCGHIHLSSHGGWRGKLITTAPSMGLQLGLDLTLTRPSEFYLESPGYLLHYYTPESNLITHLVNVRDMDGPYLFEDN
ncbi:phosphodiesterase [Desulfomarina sp.]